jgi:Glyoxalase-like domain
MATTVPIRPASRVTEVKKMRIDHAVLAVADLDDAADRLRARTGLEPIPGGRHPGWGTENRIVPLGDDYVELLAVVDRPTGEGTPLGRALLGLTQDGRDRWFSLCVRDPDIDATATRLGLTLEPGARTRPDGVTVRWRGAGIEDPRRPFWLPFFIEWEVPPDQHPGRAQAEHRALLEHRAPPTGIVGAEVAGDVAAWGDWLGGAELPVTVVQADEPARGVRSVTVGLADGGTVVI